MKSFGIGLTFLGLIALPLASAVAQDGAQTEPLTAASPDGRVEAHYDRFERKTIVMYGAGDIGNDKVPNLTFFAYIREPSKHFMYGEFEFYSHSENWHYMECHDIHWLADGMPVQTPEGQFRGSVLYSTVSETINQVGIPLSTLTRLARAKKVEYEICSDEFTLDESQMQDLRFFVATIKKSIK